MIDTDPSKVPSITDGLFPIIPKKDSLSGLICANLVWDNLPSTSSLLILLIDLETSNLEETTSRTCLLRLWKRMSMNCTWLLLTVTCGLQAETKSLLTTDPMKWALRLPLSIKLMDRCSMLNFRSLCTKKEIRPTFLPVLFPSSSIKEVLTTTTPSLLLLTSRMEALTLVTKTSPEKFWWTTSSTLLMFLNTMSTLDL